MNGTHLTLGLVGALAAAGALSRRGSLARRQPLAQAPKIPLDLPPVLYHGSPRSGLRTLTPSLSGALGPGIYLATEARDALSWGWKRGENPTVYGVRVDVRRPYLWQPEDGAQHPDLVNARVRRDGYDAIVRRTMDGSIPELIVFSAEQIVWMEPVPSIQEGSANPAMPSLCVLNRGKIAQQKGATP